MKYKDNEDRQTTPETLKTGAVVVAAGMSSRMGDFKPMMKLGSISVSQRVITTLRQGGVERIAVVTGNHADDLESHLSKNNVIFLHNDDYATTHMFDSACIGFRYMLEKCDRVLFTPVDIPLFTPHTVRSLLATDAPLVYPVCNGSTGHPILLSAEVISGVLKDSGEDGLKGALSRTGIAPLYVDVPDNGILMDADTMEDYKKLLEYQNSQLIRPIITASMSRETIFFDERTAMLLSLIDETGSVRKACESMQMSYRSSWNILNALDEQLGFPVLNRSQGGTGHRRSTLTSRGREFLERFRAYEKDLRDNTDRLFRVHFADFFDNSDNNLEESD